MRILHTSDWHLGKRLMERERLSEQRDVLREILAVCEEKEVELILIAGDVFDSFLPSAEAEGLFFHAVKELAGKDRAVVAVSGNHDDGMRLCASAPLAAEEGIYLFGGKDTPSLGGTRPVRAVEGGENYLIIENRKGERVYLNLLPYPNEARLREEKSEESYGQRAARWIAAGDEHYDGRMPHILLSHLFVAGGSVSSSERDISLGGARAVPVGALPDFGYTALGHLHKSQKAGKCGRYSGSILQYSFDEAGTQKQVVLLETKESGEVAVVEEIPLKAGTHLVRLEANSLGEGKMLLAKYPDSYIELTLRLGAPLTAEETKELCSSFPGLLSLIVEMKASEQGPVSRRSHLGARELFLQYCDSQFGEKPDEDVCALFLSLAEGEQ